MDKKMLVGGQAVIEGVMMRSPAYYAIALRKSNGEIKLKIEPFNSITKRIKILSKPFLRGIVTLIETLILGVKTLSYSADEYMQEIENTEEKAPVKKEEKKGINWEIFGTIVFSFAFGIVLFVALPLFAAQFIKSFWAPGTHYIVFNIIDGLVRLAVFIFYILGISLLKDVRRVFEYHGAEHKSVFAYENGMDLKVEHIKVFSTLHPRCGTNFMLIVILLSILVITMFKTDTFIARFGLRLLILPLLASVSYEIIRIFGKFEKNAFVKLLLAPGLLLQKITTREPDDSQMEVAAAALQAVLDAELENKK
ncbi:MAG: DUF1385 domain-containing protein [Elusimicrobiota bacterium]